MRLDPTLMLRKRPGAPVAASGTGLSGSPVVGMPPGSFVVVAKAFTLRPGSGLAGQKSGDSFDIRIRRTAADPSDTCAGLVFVESIDIRYPLRSP